MRLARLPRTIPIIAVAFLTILGVPASVQAQQNGTSAGETDGEQAHQTDPRSGTRGQAGDLAGPASTSSETKGASPVGSPNPLAGSTLGKK